MSEGDSRKRPRVTAAVMDCVRRSFELAARSRHDRVAEGHLAASLLDDRDVQAAVSAIGADPQGLRDLVLGTLSEEKRRPWYRRRPRADQGFNQVVLGAVSQAVAAELDEVTPLSVLIQLLSAREPSLLVQRLEAMDLEAITLKRHLAHGRLGPSKPAKISGPCRIVLHNDPYTTREFVVAVLVEHFGLDQGEAQRVMLETHHRGEAVLPGRLDGGEAAEKIEAITAEALEKGFPFEVTLRAV